MGLENIDSYEELKRLDAQIESATELAALKPIYFRLNEIVQAFPGDFDIQFTGNEIKQRLMARGTLLKQQAVSAPPPQPPPSAPAESPRPTAQAQPTTVETPPPAPVVEATPAPVLPATSPPVVEVPPAPAVEVAPPPAPVVENVPPAPVAAPEPAVHHESPMVIMAEPSPSFPLFPLFAGSVAQAEPPAPPAYFADTVGPAPALPPEPAVMPSATMLALSYPAHGSASAEQPLLALGVTQPEQPVPPPPPEMPEAPPPPPPVAVQEAVAPAPPVPTVAPVQEPAPFPLATSLFDFAPPPPPSDPIFPAAPPTQPAPAPVAKPEAQPPRPTFPATPERPAPPPPSPTPVAPPSRPIVPTTPEKLPDLAPTAQPSAPPPGPIFPATPEKPPMPAPFAKPVALPSRPILSTTPQKTPAPAAIAKPAAPTPGPILPASSGKPPALPTSFLDSWAAPPAPEAKPSPPATPPAGAAPPPPPPLAPVATPEKKPEAAMRPPAMPRRPFNWKRPVVIAPIAVLLVALVAGVLVMHQIRKRNAEKAALIAAAVQIDLATTPPGASVRAVADKAAAGAAEATCTSNCKLQLAPGTYQIFASLDGFEPAAQPLTVRALHPMSVTLPLQPQAPSVRLLTDLEQGKVVMDDRPAVDLQEGQLVLDKVAPGTHTIKIAGANGDASFSFVIENAHLPAVTNQVNARNMVALLVTSFGRQARVVTNAGPWKLAVNGQPQGDASPGGTDLTAFQTGVNEFVLGEGKDQRNMSETFGAAPTLTAFLKTDVNAGTLIISTGQDDVRVFLNGKEYRRLTQHGQLRVPILGKVAVRVAKNGFLDEPAQTAEVKKGAEVRLQFDLKPQPQFASLQIRGALAGTEVLVDQKSAGTVGPDGLFGISEIQPGEHSVELRREQHLPKRLQRSFQAGQAVVLAGADVVLAVSSGTVRFTRNPASAAIAYRRGDETEAREVRGNQIELPAGTYVFFATAAGFSESTTRVELGAGESREVNFTLARERAAAPTVIANAMGLFEDPQSWSKEGDNWVHKGGGFVPFKPQPKGVLTFKVELVKGGGVFRAGQIRWCLQYLDAKNYLLFEIDRKNFRAWVVKDGQRLERVPKTPHNLGNQKAFTIQIDVSADRLVQQVRGGEGWKALDNFAEPGRDYTQGKFGFLIQGNDEIAISDFKFQPR